VGCFLGRQHFGGASNTSSAAAANGAPPKDSKSTNHDKSSSVVIELHPIKPTTDGSIQPIDPGGGGGGGIEKADTPLPPLSLPSTPSLNITTGVRKNSSFTAPDGSSGSTTPTLLHCTKPPPPAATRDKTSKLAAVQVLAALVQQAKNEPYQPKLREEVPTPFPSTSSSLEPKDTRKVKRWRDAEGNKIVNEYVIIKTLGSGSYGKVKLCINTENNDFYALKICHKGILKRRKSGLSSALQVCIVVVMVAVVFRLG
jgi:hypothetical protein